MLMWRWDSIARGARGAGVPVRGGLRPAGPAPGGRDALRRLRPGPRRRGRALARHGGARLS